MIMPRYPSPLHYYSSSQERSGGRVVCLSLTAICCNLAKRANAYYGSIRISAVARRIAMCLDATIWGPFGILH